jgi:aminocarboxymuconate-semialdehyde decarboxylase
LAVIDVHTHVVPSSLADLPARHHLWPTLEIREAGRAALMIDGKPFREIDARSWDVERRMQDMAADGTDVQVLSPMPELLSHWLPAELADHLARIVNDYIVEMISRAPDKFCGIGMVPMQNAELAAKRLDDIKKQGLRGVEIGTHIDGVPLGDPRLSEFYARAEELGLLVFVHPLYPIGVERIGGPKELAAAAVFPLETALAATSLLAGRVLERFPRLNILLSHGGGALPWIAPRIEFAWKMAAPWSRAIPQAPSETLKKFWYDTIVYDPASLRFLASQVGSGRLVVGSDYPFVIRQPAPGAFAAAALKDVSFDANAAVMLGA